MQYSIKDAYWTMLLAAFVGIGIFIKDRIMGGGQYGDIVAAVLTIVLLIVIFGGLSVILAPIERVWVFYSQLKPFFNWRFRTTPFRIWNCLCTILTQKNDSLIIFDVAMLYCIESNVWKDDRYKKAVMKLRERTLSKIIITDFIIMDSLQKTTSCEETRDYRVFEVLTPVLEEEIQRNPYAEKAIMEYAQSKQVYFKMHDVEPVKGIRGEHTYIEAVISLSKITLESCGKLSAFVSDDADMRSAMERDRPHNEFVILSGDLFVEWIERISQDGAESTEKAE